MDQKTHTKINWLDRNDIILILESFGFACYAKETEDELREVLRENVMDGTIPEHVLDLIKKGEHHGV